MLLKRKKKADAASLDSTLSSKNPVDAVVDFGEDRLEARIGAWMSCLTSRGCG